jgi:hypothetical protein
MPRRRKATYQNGSCFAVPLRTGGFAVGLVARNNGKGIALGYFFGPRLSKVEEANLDELVPRDAIYVGKFGDLGLLNNEWPILGAVPQWNPRQWPLPPLVRVDEAANRAWISVYDEHSFSCLREQEVDPNTVSAFVADGTMGYGAVEVRLTKLLG